MRQPLFTRPAETVIKATMPDFDDYHEPELVKVATDASWLDCTDAELEAVSVIREPDYSKVKHYCGAELKREAASKRRIKVYASLYAPSQLDLDLERLNAGWRPNIKS